MAPFVPNVCAPGRDFSTSMQPSKSGRQGPLVWTPSTPALPEVPKRNDSRIRRRVLGAEPPGWWSSAVCALGVAIIAVGFLGCFVVIPIILRTSLMTSLEGVHGGSHRLWAFLFLLPVKRQGEAAIHRVSVPRVDFACIWQPHIKKLCSKRHQSLR